MNHHARLKSAFIALLALAAGGCGAASTADDDLRFRERSEEIDRGIELLPPAVVPEKVVVRAPALPEFDVYGLVDALTRVIDRRPEDPGPYEFRAWIWERLGWPARAAWDRAMAKALRGAAIVLP